MTDTTNALPPIPSARVVVEPMPPEDTKRWWESKGVLGAIIVVVSIVAGQLGYQVAPEDQGALTDQVFDMVGIVGALIALIGRLAATKQVSSK